MSPPRDPKALALAIFNDDRISGLAAIAKMPEDYDRARFASGIRWAVENYIEARAKPSPNKLRREIEALHAIAYRILQRNEINERDYQALANLVETMTPECRRQLAGSATPWRLLEPEELTVTHALGASGYTAKKYAKLMAEVPPASGRRVPDPAELRDPAIRKRVVEELRTLLSFGGTWKVRKRPKGVPPTQKWVPLLYAPPPTRAEPRREAEREFVMWLRVAVVEAGAVIPHAFDHRKPGPLARMVAECLVAVGAADAAHATGLAVQLLNDVHKAAKGAPVCAEGPARSSQPR